MAPTRRTALLGGLGVLGAAAAGLGGLESGLLPGRDRLGRLGGVTDKAPAGVPARDPGRLVTGSFVSAARRARRRPGAWPTRPGMTGWGCRC